MLGVVPVGRRGLVPAGVRRAAEHAQARARRSRSASAASERARRRRAHAPGRPRRASALHARARSGAPLTCSHVAVVDAVDRRHQLASAGRSGTPRARRSRRDGRDSRAEARAARSSADLGRVAAIAAPRSSVGRRAGGGRGASAASGGVGSPSGRAAVERRARRRRASTHGRPRIRFSVSVPVLSVQMTVVEPSVSTAHSRLTSAPRARQPRTPTASASVIVGSSPSGTLATSSPIAKTTASRDRQPGERAERQEREPGADGDERDEPRDAADLL